MKTLLTITVFLMYLQFKFIKFELPTNKLKSFQAYLYFERQKYIKYIINSSDASNIKVSISLICIARTLNQNSFSILGHLDFRQ